MIHKPYFHEITDAQWEQMKLDGKTWGDMQRDYLQPDWCQYPEAIDPLGCWSLTGRFVKDEEFCRTCNLHKDYKK